eukprot:c18519_g4_i1 orf=2-2038(-)
MASSSSSSSAFGSSSGCVLHWCVFSWLFLCIHFHCSPVTLANRTSISRSLVFPDFKGSRVREISTLGSAAVYESLGIVQIPGAQIQFQNFSNQAGRALYWSPVRMLDPETKMAASFDTTFSFRIDTTPADSIESSSSGLTFLIAPDEFTVGRAGGWLGMMNDACDRNYRPFAVEFDTFKNNEFGDPNDNHVGLNYGSMVSNQAADAAAAGVSLRDGSIIRAWINYNSSRRWIEVRVGKEGEEKQSLPLISAALDLSPIFREYMFVGFSAATGPTAQIHSILSWNFTSETKANLRFPKDESCVKRLLHRSYKGSKRPPSAFIVFILVMLVVFVSFLNLACVRHKRAKENPLKNLVKQKSPPNRLQSSRRFSFSELIDATSSFNDNEILDHGRSRAFFYGILRDGSQVAIKRFSRQFLQICANPNQLFKEVDLLTRLRHPNLVPLRGWCLEKGELLLVYDYMPNGSLDQWLYDPCRVLPWTRRYKIVREVANALAYLHRGWKRRCVLHKNVTTGNVFLDITFRASLGNFGLVHRRTEKGIAFPSEGQYSSILSDTQSCCCLAPEMAHSTQATTQMDVYCFGVMVLEIVSARKPIEHDFPEQARNLVEWAWQLQQKGRLQEVADSRLGLRYSLEQMTSFFQVGLCCTVRDPEERPCMDLVVKYLSGERPLPEQLLQQQQQQQ